MGLRTVLTVALAWVSTAHGLGITVETPDKVPAYLKSKRVLYPQKAEVMDQIEGFVQEQIDKGMLLNVDKAWQPSDYLPDGSQDTETFFDEVRELRKESESIPDEVLVVLVGDMITEEALPTYLTLLNTLEGTDDPSGAIDTAWGRWSRQWTAEENRHGDLLNRYLYLTGRCDMRAIETTIMHLIGSGFDPDTRSDPYRGFIYTSFQERATKISHGNVGKLAASHGSPALARICAKIAGDEARHEKAYQSFVQEVMRFDPDGALISYAEMMRNQIVMPAELMTDGNNPNLFADFQRVATDLNVYTASDYTEILEFLNQRWKIEEITGLSPEGQEAQEYVCKLPERFRKLAARAERSAKKKAPEEPLKSKWSWLHDREC